MSQRSMRSSISLDSLLWFVEQPRREALVKQITARDRSIGEQLGVMGQGKLEGVTLNAFNHTTK